MSSRRVEMSGTHLCQRARPTAPAPVARSTAFGTASPPGRAMSGRYRAGLALGASGRRVGKGPGGPGRMR